MFNLFPKKKKEEESKYLSMTRTSSMISFDLKEATDSAMKQFGSGTVFPKEMADQLREAIKKEKERDAQIYIEALNKI